MAGCRYSVVDSSHIGGEKTDRVGNPGGTPVSQSILT